MTATSIHSDIGSLAIGMVRSLVLVRQKKIADMDGWACGETGTRPRVVVHTAADGSEDVEVARAIERDGLATRIAVLFAGILAVRVVGRRADVARTDDDETHIVHLCDVSWNAIAVVIDEGEYRNDALAGGEFSTVTDVLVSAHAQFEVRLNVNVIYVGNALRRSDDEGKKNGCEQKQRDKNDGKRHDSVARVHVRVPCLCIHRHSTRHG